MAVVDLEKLMWGELTIIPALGCYFSTRAVSVSVSQHSISHIAAGAAASTLRLLYSDGHGRRPFALLFRNAAASVAVAAALPIVVGAVN